jgi:hypothetical protein
LAIWESSISSIKTAWFGCGKKRYGFVRIAGKSWHASQNLISPFFFIFVFIVILAALAYSEVFLYYSYIRNFPLANRAPDI